MVDWDVLGDDDPFVVVTPKSPHKDDTIVWRDPQKQVERELEFLREELCLDEEQIFVLGHGAGGAAAEKLACEMANVRGVATSAYRPGPPPCEPAPGIRRLHIAPTEDPAAPFEGGTTCLHEQVSSAAEYTEELRRLHECGPGAPLVQDVTGGTCREWKCGSPLRVCEVAGGRRWPGYELPERVHLIRPKCRMEEGTFHYTETIWGFFGEALHE